MLLARRLPIDQHLCERQLVHGACPSAGGGPATLLCRVYQGLNEQHRSYEFSQLHGIRLQSQTKTMLHGRCRIRASVRPPIEPLSFGRKFVLQRHERPRYVTNSRRDNWQWKEATSEQEFWSKLVVSTTTEFVTSFKLHGSTASHH